MRRARAPAERAIRSHRYLDALAAGRVPESSLGASAGEQFSIISSDRRSFAHLAGRFPESPAGDFFLSLAAGEGEARSRLGGFAAAVGLGEEGLRAYEQARRAAPPAGVQAPLLGHARGGPLTNWETQAARRYHERTKHSWRSVRARAHYLDWGNRPKPFKEYRGLEPLPLPGDVPELGVGTGDAIAAEAGSSSAPLTLPALTRLLRWGAGVVRTRTSPGGGTYHFRTYASAGALYPVEVYVACAELPALAAGLYHFHPGELALRRLRAGDVRGPLAAAADAAGLAQAGAVVLLTGILWRSAWKYQERAYRHLFWDAGTMLANLLALAGSAGLGPYLATGFVDAEVNRLLGVDGEREAALALLAVGRASRPASSGELEPLELEVSPLSVRELSYPEARALQAASSLWTVGDVRRYRAGGKPLGGPPVAAEPRPSVCRDSLEGVIRRRGSAREFTLDSVAAFELTALLDLAAAPLPADVPPLNSACVIANALAGLEPGIYRFEAPGCWQLVRTGSFRAQAGYLCLEQALGASAAAAIFFLAHLDEALGALGNRGYRAAQLEAGIRAGRVYLGAYAEGLGATGLTFYDDDVSEFLAPGTGLSPMLCVAVGVDTRRPR